MTKTIQQIKKYIRKTTPITYPNLLSEIQKEATNSLWELHQGASTKEEKKEKLLSFIAKEIHDRKTQFTDFSQQELIQRLYNDIDAYSVLTEFLSDKDVEGININAWNDIRVMFVDGSSIKANSFNSPQHATSIIKRLLQQSNVTIDSAIPIAESSLDSNTRITAVMTPIVDENVGVAGYIRKLREEVFSQEEYIKRGFANEAVLRLLQIAAKRGVSSLYLGKVNTGKTTLVKHILSSLPDDRQTITVEAGAREMNLVKHDEEYIKNNIIHMLTRSSDIEEQNITQEKLVVIALRLNPDVLSIAEMRNIEAYAAIEASISGHTVISTAHAGSAKNGHKRIANLSRKVYQTDAHTALVDACTAFPLSAFIHTTDDGIRRIMNVTECYIDGNDTIHYKTLWEYRIEENVVDEYGKMKIKGEYVQVNNPSDDLVARMKLYGITSTELNSLFIQSEKEGLIA